MSDHVRVDAKCDVCGHLFGRTGNPGPCPNCGERKHTINVGIEDGIKMYDELEIVATNRQGELVAERIQKTDLNTSSNLSADRGKPLSVSADRKSKITGFIEEGEYAGQLVRSYNKLHGTNYVVEAKEEEDDEFEDRILVDPADSAKRMPVQIRHLDSEIAAKVGSLRGFDGERSEADVIKSIRKAIEAKALFDAQTKAKSILQLIVPAALGRGMKAAIEGEAFDFGGFKEVWISPFHEESFPLKLKKEGAK